MSEQIEQPEVMEEPKADSESVEVEVEEKEPQTDKWKHDLHRFKSEAKDAKARAEALEKQLKEREESSLREKGRYKELYEAREQEVNQLKDQVSKSKDVFFNTLKRAEIEKAAMKMGIRKEALYDLDLLDKSDVEVETTDRGNVNILGAEEFVNEIKATRPHWFQDMGAPVVNTANPNYAGPKQYSATELLELQRTNPQKYKEEIAKRLKR